MQLDSDPASVTIPGKQAAMAAAGLKPQGEETYPLNSETAARLLQLQREWAKRKEEEEVDELELREEELALAEATAELALKKKEVMLEKARLAVHKRKTRRRKEEAAARYEGESVYGCSSIPLHGGSELGVPSQISTAGSSHVFCLLWSEEKVPMPDEPDSMVKPIHFPQESFPQNTSSMGPPILQMTICRDGPTAYLLLWSDTRIH